MKSLRFCVVLFAIVCLSVQILNAQQDITSLIGIPEHSHTLPVRFGFVNLDNGNLHLEFPLFSVSERGHSPESATLVYDSLFWGPVSDGTGVVRIEPSGGWNNAIVSLGNPPLAAASTGANTTVRQCSNYSSGDTGTITAAYTYNASDSHGTSHTFYVSPAVPNMSCYKPWGAPLE